MDVKIAKYIHTVRVFEETIFFIYQFIYLGTNAQCMCKNRNIGPSTNANGLLLPDKRIPDSNGSWIDSARLVINWVYSFRHIKSKIWLLFLGFNPTHYQKCNRYYCET